MARKRGSHAVLEWVSMTKTTAVSTGVDREVIQLALDDDEIAEILRIDSMIQSDIKTFVFSAPSLVLPGLQLSMDPSVSTATNPYSEDQYEDLETFYSHLEPYEVNPNDAAGSIDQFQFTGKRKHLTFPERHPMIVATNVAALLNRSGTVAIQYFVRIYFTRTKATDQQLVRTLLKRR
jgi:hypothetical protein